MKKLFYLSLVFIMGTTQSQANNIEVKNISLTGQNTAQHYSFIKFDLSWENSWRLAVGPANWDAAWVFVKYRVNGGDWNHARLNYINGTTDGHTVPAGASIHTDNDGLAYGLGSFIYRSANGSGDVNYQGVQLRWNYGANGVGDNDLVDVQVFAVEMVYVPQGSFYLGGGEGNEIAKFFKQPNSNSSYYVTSENPITVGTSAGNLYYATVDGGDQAGPIPAAFPKGYNAFYCMKYEVSQDQWISFFNTLTNTQKANRDITDPTHKNSDAIVTRNAVAFDGYGSASTSLPNVPVTFINGQDGLAYLDWAALRPMTEMEFEKSCRGPVAVVSGEYAWGTSSINATNYVLQADGTPSELLANPAASTGNAFYNGTYSFGPARCGIFAASALNKNREETGGSYYGIMELSGNVSESVIMAGLPAGRSFTGNNGDGVLALNGSQNVSGWLTEGGRKGGSFFRSKLQATVNDRVYGNTANNYASIESSVHRGVRSAN